MFDRRNYMQELFYEAQAGRPRAALETIGGVVQGFKDYVVSLALNRDIQEQEFEQALLQFLQWHAFQAGMASRF